MYQNYIFFLILFIILTYGLLKILIPILNKYLLSYPNERDSHLNPTPRGGGIVFLFTSFIFIFFSNQYTFVDFYEFKKLVLIATPLALIGLIDDKLNLKSLTRYSVQILTGILILKYIEVGYYSLSFENFSRTNYFLATIILVIFITAVINFINFMDGIDGLVAGVLVISFSYIAITSFPFLYFLVGSLIGFLMLNWNPAKVFMGDIGSTYLGCIYAGLILMPNSIELSFKFILIGTPLFADSFLCILRRYFHKQNIFKPHKEHLYQRLHRNGWSHSKVSSIYILGSIALALTAYFYSLGITISVAILEIIIGIVFDRFFALKFRG